MDELRGIAALLVLIFHLGAIYGGPVLAPRGYLAVDFFFLLSGFVIGLAYEDRMAAGLPPRSFMLARLGRLYPVLAGGTALGLAVMAAGLHREPFSPALLLNLAVMPVFGHGDIFPANVVLWSLFFELLANFCHALAFPVLTTQRLAALVCAAGLVLIHSVVAVGHASLGNDGHWPLAISLLGGFARVGWSYGLGLLVCRLVRSGALSVPPCPARVAPLLLMLAVLAPLPRVLGDLLCIGFILPLTLLAGIGAGGGAWSRSAVWLGSISYPLYAFHDPLLTLARQAAAQGLWPASNLLLFWLSAVAAAIACAGLIERYYERPVRTWLGARARRSAPSPAGA